MCSGVIDEELNGANIVAVPLKEEGDMEIGILTHHRIRGSRMSEFYIQALRNYISWKNAEEFLNLISLFSQIQTKNYVSRETFVVYYNL